jgi:small-conductance mechanosensitive channel
MNLTPTAYKTCRRQLSSFRHCRDNNAIAKEMTMAASDRFMKLGEQIDQAQDNINAAAAQDEAELRVKLDAARNRADQQAAHLQANADKDSERAKGSWSKIQQDWGQHVQSMRARVDEQKTALDAKHAEHNAERAEADALDAVDFAAGAIEEAEYAVLDAALARMDADALVA